MAVLDRNQRYFHSVFRVHHYMCRWASSRIAKPSSCHVHSTYGKNWSTRCQPCIKSNKCSLTSCSVCVVCWEKTSPVGVVTTALPLLSPAPGIGSSRCQPWAYCAHSCFINVSDIYASHVYEPYFNRRWDGNTSSSIRDSHAYVWELGFLHCMFCV